MVRLIRYIAFVWLVCCVWTANPTGAVAAEPVRIGAVLPFSGGVELYGGQAKRRPAPAAQEINPGGGPPPPPGRPPPAGAKTPPARPAGGSGQKIRRRHAPPAV